MITPRNSNKPLQTCRRYCSKLLVSEATRCSGDPSRILALTWKCNNSQFVVKTVILNSAGLIVCLEVTYVCISNGVIPR